MTISKGDALQSLKPGAEWAWTGSDYSGLVWKDSKQTQPTESEINAELTRLQTDYANKKYQRDRQAEYPKIDDQIDDIYHNGIYGRKGTIKTIKDKYPKA